MGKLKLNVLNIEEPKKLDIDDPKIKSIVESSIRQQQEMIRLKNLPFQNASITI